MDGDVTQLQVSPTNVIIVLSKFYRPFPELPGVRFEHAANNFDAIVLLSKYHNQHITELWIDYELGNDETCSKVILFLTLSGKKRLFDFGAIRFVECTFWVAEKLSEELVKAGYSRQIMLIPETPKTPTSNNPYEGYDPERELEAPEPATQLAS